MSTNVGMGACCLSGHVHEGTPKGRVEEVGGLKTYIAEPESKSKSQVVVFITDIFGNEFKNVRLLADNYASNGFYVYIPDILNGDALPHSFLTDNVEPPLKDQEQEGLIDKAKNSAIVSATFATWLPKHREAITLPLVTDFLTHVRKQPGVGKIGTIGFCFGGRYAILTAQSPNIVDAAYACHPAMLSIPDDVEKVVKPLSIAVGTRDSLLDDKSNDQIKEVLDKKTDVPTELIKYEDQIHGFALRSDWSSDKDKKAMDAAEKQGVAWFKKYLQ